jgi:hypothetical protein
MRVWCVIGLVCALGVALGAGPAEARAKRGVTSKSATVKSATVKSAAAATIRRPLRLTPPGRALKSGTHRKARSKAAHRHGYRSNAVRHALRRANPRATTGYASPADAIRLGLTALQLRLVHRAIVEEPLHPKPVVTEAVARPPVAGARTGAPPPAGPPAAPAAEVTVGGPLPQGVALRELPRRAVEAAPRIESYRYAIVGDRVLLVDPDSGVVAAELRP